MVARGCYCQGVWLQGGVLLPGGVVVWEGVDMTARGHDSVMPWDDCTALRLIIVSKGSVFAIYVENCCLRQTLSSLYVLRR